MQTSVFVKYCTYLFLDLHVILHPTTRHIINSDDQELTGLLSLQAQRSNFDGFHIFQNGI